MDELTEYELEEIGGRWCFVWSGTSCMSGVLLKEPLWLEQVWLCKEHLLLGGNVLMPLDNV